MSRFDAHCCQRCGEPIGYLGRGIDTLTRPVGFTLHRCNPPLPPLQRGEIRFHGPLPREIERLRRGTWWGNLRGRVARWRNRH